MKKEQCLMAQKEFTWQMKGAHDRCCHAKNEGWARLIFLAWTDGLLHFRNWIEGPSYLATAALAAVIPCFQRRGGGAPQEPIQS